MIIKACGIGARAPAYTCMTYFTSQNETNFDSKTRGICCFINNGSLVAVQHICRYCRFGYHRQFYDTSWSYDFNLL